MWCWTGKKYQSTWIRPELPGSKHAGLRRLWAAGTRLSRGGAAVPAAGWPEGACLELEHPEQQMAAVCGTNPKLGDPFYFREEYPNPSRWALSWLTHLGAVQLSLSINVSGYSTCNKFKKTEHLYNRSTKKDYNSNVASHSLCIITVLESYSLSIYSFLLKGTIIPTTQHAMP